MKDILPYIDPDLDTRNLIHWNDKRTETAIIPLEWVLWRKYLPPEDQIRITRMLRAFRRCNLTTLREMKSVNLSELTGNKFIGFGQKGQKLARIALDLNP